MKRKRHKNAKENQERTMSDTDYNNVVYSRFTHPVAKNKLTVFLHSRARLNQNVRKLCDTKLHLVTTLPF